MSKGANNPKPRILLVDAVPVRALAHVGAGHAGGGGGDEAGAAVDPGQGLDV